MEKGSKRTINAWAFYDWANSAYPLVISATIFPIYYEGITRTETSDMVTFLGMNFKNTALYTYAIAFANLLIAAFSPLLSGIADSSGNKKVFMKFFCYLGALSCSLMYFFDKDSLGLGIALVVFACVGYYGSVVFYNAYLPEIVEREMQDRVSAKGFAMGYLGSSLLLITCLIVVMMPQLFFDVQSKYEALLLANPGMNPDEVMQMAKRSFGGQASRLAFLSVGIWWIGFAQYPFYYLKDVKTGTKLNKNFLTQGYKNIRKVWHELKEHPKLTRYLSAFFVYNMGVQTVMLVATLFGKKEIGMERSALITTILIIQFVAIAGAYIFSYVSTKIGNIRTLQIATFVWIWVCVIAYFVQTATQFYVIAFLVGLVMGGIQAMSRSTYSKMLPETVDHASYFSFYDVCEKIGIVLGMALFGILEEASNSMRNPVLALLSFFLVGFYLLSRVERKGEEQVIAK